MKISIALIVASLVVTPALAATNDADGKGSGHYAWIADPIIGPKSGMPTDRHVWIPDVPTVAAGRQPGHWQWVSEFSVGPRAGAPIRHRIWVSDQ
jgi:hypothetical protein